MTRDRQIDLQAKPNAAVKENPAVLTYFRQPSKLIRTDGIVATTSKGIAMGLKTDVDKAKAIYEWDLLKIPFAMRKVKGCGIGDISTMLESGYLVVRRSLMPCTSVLPAPRDITRSRCLWCACRRFVGIQESWPG